jgi:hypothetical protein
MHLLLLVLLLLLLLLRLLLTRKGHGVSNAHGNLDAYVVHFDEPDLFGSVALKPIWNTISSRMRALLPQACKRDSTLSLSRTLTLPKTPEP